jgi:hypothetical protein
MEAVIAHLQERWKAYLVVFIILLPAMYACRKQLWPAILWAIESVIYIGCLHVVIHYLVAILRWFKGEATFHAINEEKVDTGWNTPLLEFWKQDQYFPQWIYYVEIAFFLAIVVLVVRNRPHRYKNMRERMKETDAKKRNYTPPRPKTGAYK